MGTMMNEILGRRIKALRRTKGCTREQAADRLGISRREYDRIENGDVRITLAILMETAEMLGAAVGDITGALDEEPAAVYQAGTDKHSSKMIFDMLDLFYANKHMYMRLQHSSRE